uniref:Uncharacterized protein n=1 Tax=Arundo donax TaxID=35708 RepID=A0A0A9EKU9_ARUDO
MICHKVIVWTSPNPSVVGNTTSQFRLHREKLLLAVVGTRRSDPGKRERKRGEVRTEERR